MQECEEDLQNDVLLVYPVCLVADNRKQKKTNKKKQLRGQVAAYERSRIYLVSPCQHKSNKTTHTHLQKQTQKNSLGFMGMMQSYTDELKAAQAGHKTWRNNFKTKKGSMASKTKCRRAD